MGIPSPSQTIGPLFGFALMFEGSESAIDPDDPAAIVIEGRLIDGEGNPVAYPDGLLEVWQGEIWARDRTDTEGRYRVIVRKPDASPVLDGAAQAPHLNVTVFARGLLKCVQTRIYFPEEEMSNATDPVLGRVPAEDRHTLIASSQHGTYQFDIHLQGPGETTFFEL